MPFNSQDPKKRAIIFRLTENEYALLKNASSRARRSLSDYARAELLNAIADREGGGAGGGSHNIAEQLSGLQASVDNLKELVTCMITEVRNSRKQIFGAVSGRDPGRSG
jgi:hypothetical protein